MAMAKIRYGQRLITVNGGCTALVVKHACSLVKEKAFVFKSDKSAFKLCTYFSEKRFGYPARLALPTILSTVLPTVTPQGYLSINISSPRRSFPSGRSLIIPELVARLRRAMRSQSFGTRIPVVETLRMPILTIYLDNVLLQEKHRPVWFREPVPKTPLRVTLCTARDSLLFKHVLRVSHRHV